MDTVIIPVTPVFVNAAPRLETERLYIKKLKDFLEYDKNFSNSPKSHPLSLIRRCSFKPNSVTLFSITSLVHFN